MDKELITEQINAINIMIKKKEDYNQKYIDKKTNEIDLNLRAYNGRYSAENDMDFLLLTREMLFQDLEELNKKTKIQGTAAQPTEAQEQPKEPGFFTRIGNWIKNLFVKKVELLPKQSPKETAITAQSIINEEQLFEKERTEKMAQDKAMGRIALQNPQASEEVAQEYFDKREYLSKHIDRETILKYIDPILNFDFEAELDKYPLHRMTKETDRLKFKQEMFDRYYVLSDLCEWMDENGLGYLSPKERIAYEKGKYYINTMFYPTRLAAYYSPASFTECLQKRLDEKKEADKCFDYYYEFKGILERHDAKEIDTSKFRTSEAIWDIKNYSVITDNGKSRLNGMDKPLDLISMGERDLDYYRYLSEEASFLSDRLPILNLSKAEENELRRRIFEVRALYKAIRLRFENPGNTGIDARGMFEKRPDVSASFVLKKCEEQLKQYRNKEWKKIHNVDNIEKDKFCEPYEVLEWNNYVSEQRNSGNQLAPAERPGDKITTKIDPYEMSRLLRKNGWYNAKHKEDTPENNRANFGEFFRELSGGSFNTFKWKDNEEKKQKTEEDYKQEEPHVYSERIKSFLEVRNLIQNRNEKTVNEFIAPVLNFDLEKILSDYNIIGGTPEQIYKNLPELWREINNLNGLIQWTDQFFEEKKQDTKYVVAVDKINTLANMMTYIQNGLITMPIKKYCELEIKNANNMDGYEQNREALINISKEVNDNKDNLPGDISSDEMAANYIEEIKDFKMITLTGRKRLLGNESADLLLQFGKEDLNYYKSLKLKADKLKSWKAADTSDAIFKRNTLLIRNVYMALDKRLKVPNCFASDIYQDLRYDVNYEDYSSLASINYDLQSEGERHLKILEDCKNYKKHFEEIDEILNDFVNSDVKFKAYHPESELVQVKYNDFLKMYNDSGWFNVQKKNFATSELSLLRFLRELNNAGFENKDKDGNSKLNVSVFDLEFLKNTIQNCNEDTVKTVLAPLFAFDIKKELETYNFKACKTHQDRVAVAMQTVENKVNLQQINARIQWAEIFAVNIMSPETKKLFRQKASEFNMYAMYYTSISAPSNIAMNEYMEVNIGDDKSIDEFREWLEHEDELNDILREAEEIVESKKAELSELSDEKLIMDIKTFSTLVDGKPSLIGNEKYDVLKENGLKNLVYYGLLKLESDILISRFGETPRADEVKNYSKKLNNLYTAISTRFKDPGTLRTQIIYSCLLNGMEDDPAWYDKMQDKELRQYGSSTGK